jgi:hypothetical protein
MEFDFMHHAIKEKNMLRVIAVGLGFISILLGLLFRFIIKYALFKGIAISFFIGGIVLISIGLNYSTVLFHHVLSVISIVSLVFGFLLLIKTKNTTFQFWKGLGIGIMIQGVIVMCFSITNSIREEKVLKLKSRIEIKSN